MIVDEMLFSWLMLVVVVDGAHELKEKMKGLMLHVDEKLYCFDKWELEAYFMCRNHAC